MTGRLRALLVAASFGLLLSGCSPETMRPEAVDTCADLVPIGERLVEDYLEVVDGLSLDVLTGVEPPPAALVTLSGRGRQLDQRVVALGCDAAEVNSGIAEATTELEARTPAGGAFLEVVRSGVVGGLPEPLIEDAP